MDDLCRFCGLTHSELIAIHGIDSDNENKQNQQNCRLPLSNNQSYTFNNDELNLIQKIRLCLPININDNETDDQLPTKICADCCRQTNQTYEFCQQIHRTEEWFRKQLSVNKCQLLSSSSTSSTLSIDGVSEKIRKLPNLRVQKIVIQRLPPQLAVDTAITKPTTQPRVRETLEKLQKSAKALTISRISTIALSISSASDPNIIFDESIEQPIAFDLNAVSQRDEKQQHQQLKTITKVATVLYDDNANDANDGDDDNDGNNKIAIANDDQVIINENVEHIAADHDDYDNQNDNFIDDDENDDDDDDDDDIDDDHDYINDNGDKNNTLISDTNDIDKLIRNNTIDPLNESDSNNKQNDSSNISNDVPIAVANANIQRQKSKLNVNQQSQQQHHPLPKYQIVQITNPAAYVCITCKQKFPAFEPLKEHMQNNSICKQIPLTCDTCGKVCETRKSLYQHTLTHRDKNKFICDECGKTYSNRFNLENHKSAVHGEHVEEYGSIYKCKVCDGQFTSRRELYAHINAHPRLPSVHLCDACGKCFNSLDALRSHIRNHLNQRPFPCNNCEKRFRSRLQLKQHSHIHTGIKPFNCDDCGKAFAKKGSLIAHVRTMHTGEQPYQCRYCADKFTSTNKLKTHEKNHIMDK